VTQNKSPISADYALLLTTLILVFLGLVMIYSSSAIWAERHLGQPLYFIKRQIFWAALGFTIMAAISRVNYNLYRKRIGLMLTLTIVILVLALLGHKVGGARRWIKLGPIGLQPSEFAKLSCVLFLSYYLDKKRSRLRSLATGVLIPALVLSPIILLIAREPDLGTPLLIFAVFLELLFIAGVRLRHIFTALSLSIPAIAYELIRYPYRRARLLHFFSPIHDAQNTGYQLAQSIMAVGSGGVFGKGLGASNIKLMYLPTPHTDFIFPILCEELGLVGALGLLSLFIFLTIRGTRIARDAPNLFGTLLAAGITSTIALQAFFNMAMSLGLLPTKGIPIPFVSFGGSSLLASLIGIGILLNISRQKKMASQ
jgi:cell division protein FtsW